MAFHDAVARACTPADKAVHTEAGHAYTNHGPVLSTDLVPGAALMFFHEGSYYVADVARVSGGHIQFTGDPRWLNPLGMYLLTKDR